MLSAASIPTPIRSRWPALRPPDGGYDLVGTYAEANGLTLEEAIARLADLAGLLPAPAERETEA